jgi:hypothetical protein
VTYVIGLTGRKGSGKDTAAAVYEAYGAEKLKMADGLKTMLSSLLIFQGVSEQIAYRMIEGDLKEVDTPFFGGRSPRFAMQTLGTEWGRNLMGEHFWVNIFANAVATSAAQLVVCSDVRFPNEVDAIHQMNGKVYRVDREGIDKSDAHPSEVLIDGLKVDGVILNTATTAEGFQEQVSAFFQPPVGNQKH